jgi:hypothetical protein
VHPSAALLFKGIVSRNFGVLSLFHWKDMKFVIRLDQIIFQFNDIFIFKLSKRDIRSKDHYLSLNCYRKEDFSCILIFHSESATKSLGILAEFYSYSGFLVYELVISSRITGPAVDSSSNELVISSGITIPSVDSSFMSWQFPPE